MESTEQDRILEMIRNFLIEKGLDATDADIYILALKIGSATSGSVVKNVKGIASQTTAKEKLKRLEVDGYFESTPGEGEGGRGKKGKPVVYRPIPPSIVLKEPLKGAVTLYGELNRLDEMLEIGRDIENEDEVWITKNEEAALGRLVQTILGASREILSYCRDGSWWDDRDIRKALEKIIAEKGIKVMIITTSMSKERRREIEKIGVQVIKSNLPMAPFFIVDRSILFLPQKTGRLGTKYGSIRFTNHYLVNNFARLIDHQLKKQECEH